MAERMKELREREEQEAADLQRRLELERIKEQQERRKANEALQ